MSALAACTEGNQAPVAYDYAATLDEDSSTSGLLLARDPERAPLYYELGTPPAHGEVVIDRTTGQFTYRPAPDFNGIDSFRFQVSDQRTLSAPATVSLTIAPVNDAPVAIDPGALQNSAYTLSTEIPLPITDVDGDSLIVTVYSSDTKVATVSTDSHTLTITPTGAGIASIHVAASDGEYNAATDFAFNVRDVTKDVVITPTPGEPNVISLGNSTPRAATFTLTYNGHQAFVSAEAAAAYIRDDMPREFPAETFPRRLWRYVRDNTYHDLSLGTDDMWYDLWTTVNSLGWGLCGNVAAVYVEIARAAGYEARVWGLTGHVVPEIYVDGRWEMYGPDLAVYYYNHDGNVAGVEELAQDSTLITSPIDPILPSLAGTNSGPYTALLADIYATTSDNYVATTNFRALEPSGSTLILLPAGARLSLAGHWTDNPIGTDDEIARVIPEYRQAALRLPAGWTGSIPLPWVLWAVQGGGAIRIEDRAFSAGDPALDAYLKAPGAPMKSIEVVSNTAGLRLVFLINAMWYDVLSRNEVSIHGQDVWAVTVGARTVSEDVATGSFPDSLRKPTDVVVQ